MEPITLDEQPANLPAVEVKPQETTKIEDILLDHRGNAVICSKLLQALLPEDL